MEPKEHGLLRVVVAYDPLFQANTLLLWSKNADECWVVDPGFAPSVEYIATAIQKRDLRLSSIVVTHGHVDHIAGIEELRSLYPGARIWAPRADAHMLPDAEANLSAPFGLRITAPPADLLLDPDQKLILGGLEFETLDASGHSPGGMAFYCEAAKVVITGDALFAESIGRTDFPGADLDQLLRNISNNLLTLPEETVVYSGHGPTSTIADIQRDNPYVQRGYLE